VSAALVIQHAKRVRRIMLLSVACLTVPPPSILPQKRQNFRRKVSEHKTRVFFTTVSEKFLITEKI
jgi:hypothetical protein